MPCMILFETDPLYARRPAAIAAAAAFIAIDELVFLTSGAFTSGAATTILLVRTGRAAGEFEGSEEVRDFVLSAAAMLSGWFVGRLDVDLTTLARSWAMPVETKLMVRNSAQNDRYEIFFKFFKMYTPKIIY
jgi:hypothetical protein